MSRILGLFLCICCIWSCQKPVEKLDEDARNPYPYGSKAFFDYYDDAIKKEPNNGTWYYRKAVPMFRLGRKGEAMRNLDIAAKLDPIAYANYCGYAKILHFRDFKGAENMFRICLENKVYHDAIVAGDTYTRLGVCLKEQGLYDEAIEAFTKQIERDGLKDVMVYAIVSRGISKLEKDDKQGALADFNLALENWDRCPEAFYYKALVLYQLNEKDKACKQIQKAMLNENVIRSNPFAAHIDQLSKADMDKLFDQTCR